MVSLEFGGFIECLIRTYSHWNLVVSSGALIHNWWFYRVVSLELGGFIECSHWNLVVSSGAFIGTWWFHQVVSLELGGFIMCSHLNSLERMLDFSNNVK